MAPEKVTQMVLYVDLKCSGCYKKVKKVLCKMPQIRDQEFDVDKNKVNIRVVCCSPENIRDKLCYKGGGAIQSIEIIEKPNEPAADKPKVVADKPKEPVAKPKEPADKPKVAPEKPKELAKAKPPADKPKEPEKAKPAAEKPKEPEKAKPAAEKPKEPEKAKPAADKPKEPEKAKPAADKPKEPEKPKLAADKPKEPEAKPAADKPKDTGKPKEPEKPKPADKPKDSGKPLEPEKAKPKDAEKPSPPKEVPIKADAGDVAKMVYEPVHGYPHMYPLPAYPMVGYGQYYDHYYDGAPFQHGYGVPVVPPPPPPPSYVGFGYENEYNGYNGNRSYYASNDYGGEEDENGCSIM